LNGRRAPWLRLGITGCFARARGEPAAQRAEVRQPDAAIDAESRLFRELNATIRANGIQELTAFFAEVGAVWVVCLAARTRNHECVYWYWF